MWSSHAMAIRKRIEFALSPIEGLELGLKKITGWTIRILGQSSGGGLSLLLTLTRLGYQKHFYPDFY